jgi:hypothetical protein
MTPTGALVLDQRHLKSEIGQIVNDGNHRHGERHQAEIGRDQEARKDDHAEKADTAVRESQTDHPERPASNALV